MAYAFSLFLFLLIPVGISSLQVASAAGGSAKPPRAVAVQERGERTEILQEWRHSNHGPHRCSFKESDVPNVAHVINYDFPKSIEDYVHRIGRTGKAGKAEVATAFLTESNHPLAKGLLKLMTEEKRDVPEWLLVYANKPCHGGSTYGGRGRRGGSRAFDGKDYRHRSDYQQQQQLQHYGAPIRGPSRALLGWRDAATPPPARAWPSRVRSLGTDSSPPLPYMPPEAAHTLSPKGAWIAAIVLTGMCFALATFCLILHYYQQWQRSRRPLLPGGGPPSGWRLREVELASSGAPPAGDTSTHHHTPVDTSPHHPTSPVVCEIVVVEA